MAIELDEVKTSKLTAFDRLLEDLERARKSLDLVLADYTHHRITEIRLIRSKTWIAHARSAAYDGREHAKKFD